MAVSTLTAEASALDAALPARPYNRFTRAVATASTLCGFAAAGMMVAAVGVTCQMIWIRFVMNGSTVWQTEAVIYLMVGATLIGLPYVQLLRGHVNVDLLPRLLPRGLRFALAMVTFGLSITVIAAMTFYGFEMWRTAWLRGWTSDTVWAPKLWVPYLAMPLGFGLYLLQLIADLTAVLTGAEQPFPSADDASHNALEV